MNNTLIILLVTLQLNCLLIGMEIETQNSLIQCITTVDNDIKTEIINHTKQLPWWYLNQVFDCDEKAYDDKVYAVYFNHTGPHLAAASYDNKALISDIEKNTIVATVNHNDWVTTVCFNATGTHLATGSRDKKACILDIQKNTLLSSFEHNGAIDTVCFNYAGTHLATGSRDNKACIFDIQTKTLVASFEHNGWVNSVCFNSAGTHLATGSYDKKARIFDIQTKTLVASFEHNGWVNSVCFNSAGTHLATSSFDKKKRIFARYDNYTLQQLQLKYALLTWLLIQKPDKTINTIELLIKDVALKHSDSEETLTEIWKTLPENMQSALWRTMLYTIKKHGKR